MCEELIKTLEGFIRCSAREREEDHVKGIKREVEEVVMNYYIRSYMTSDGVPGMSLLKQTCKIPSASE